MIRSVFWLAVALAALPPRDAVAADPPPPPACKVPAELLASAHPLAHLGRALQPGGQLDVLALGSGTLLGPRGGVEGSVPDDMVASLRAASPGAAIRLTLHAARAETATEMLAALRRELVAHAYQLVLWQTGTVEAVRKLPPAQFRQTLADGAGAVAAAGADLLLIDVPYSRLLESNFDLQPYRAAIREAADSGAALLFRRYDLMRAWAKSGNIDVEEAGRRERTHTAERLRACLGEALAQLVLAGREP